MCTSDDTALAVPDLVVLMEVWVSGRAISKRLHPYVYRAIGKQHSKSMQTIDLWTALLGLRRACALDVTFLI